MHYITQNSSYDPKPKKDKTIKVIVKGGVVMDVKNIPDGYEVQIIDHDVEQPKLKQLEFPFPELRANV